METQVIALIVAVMILLVYLLWRKKSKSAFHAGNGPISLPIKYNTKEGVYVIAVKIGGKRFNVVVDAGSNYLNVPNSLPCRGCVPTGQRYTITYADNSTDNLVFTRGTVELGGHTFPSLVFGGTSNSKGANTSGALGLMSLVSPSGYKHPVGESVTDQLGAKSITLDLRKNAGTLTYWPGSPDFGQATPAVQTPLISNQLLWDTGIDFAGDFNVIRASSPQIPGMIAMIIDSGATYSHFPVPPGFNTAEDLTITFGGVTFTVKSSAFVRGSGGSNQIGVLGMSFLKGWQVSFDHNAGQFSLYH